MRRVTKTCPKCGHKASYTGFQCFYGSPYRVCTGCGLGIYDEDYREIAVDGIRKSDIARIPIGLLSITAFFSMLGIGLVISGFEKQEVVSLIFGLLIIGVLLWVFIGEVRSYKSKLEFFEKEKLASEARMHNLDYAVSLAKLGHNVPEKYLEECDPRVLKDIKNNSIVAELKIKRKWKNRFLNIGPYASAIAFAIFTLCEIVFWIVCVLS